MRYLIQSSCNTSSTLNQQNRTIPPHDTHACNRTIPHGTHACKCAHSVTSPATHSHNIATWHPCMQMHSFGHVPSDTCVPRSSTHHQCTPGGGEPPGHRGASVRCRTSLPGSKVTWKRGFTLCCRPTSASALCLKTSETNRVNSKLD
jgi:hypothetical protein